MKGNPTTTMRQQHPKSQTKRALRSLTSIVALAMLLPTASADGIWVSDPTGNSGAGIDVSTGDDTGAAQAYGSCDVAVTACSVSAAAITHICAHADGSLVFPAHMEFCVDAVAAGGGGLARVTTSAVVWGHGVVKWTDPAKSSSAADPCKGWKRIKPSCWFAGPPSTLNEVATYGVESATDGAGTAKNETQKTAVKDCVVDKSILIDGLNWLLAPITCTAAATHVGTYVCASGEGQGSGYNGVYMMAMPAAKVDSCSQSGTTGDVNDFAAGFGLGAATSANVSVVRSADLSPVVVHNLTSLVVNHFEEMHRRMSGNVTKPELRAVIDNFWNLAEQNVWDEENTGFLITKVTY